MKEREGWWESREDGGSQRLTIKISGYSPLYKKSKYFMRHTAQTEILSSIRVAQPVWLLLSSVLIALHLEGFG